MTILYILFAFFFALPDSAEISSQTMEQVKNYVSNLEEDSNRSLYLWGLSEIASLDCVHNDFVIDQLSQIDEFSNNLENFRCSNVRDQNLSDFLNELWDVETRDLYLRILENEQPLTKEKLSFNKYSLIHFNLLMRSDARTFYTGEYLELALESWLKQGEKYQDKDSLEYALLIASIIRGAFIIDKYHLIEEYSVLFLKDQHLPNSIHKLRLLGAVDYAFYVYDFYGRSLKLQRENSLPLADFLGEKELVKTIKNRHGAYLYSLGKYKEAKTTYEELYNDSDTFENQYALFTNLGATYFKLGQANKYINFQIKALDQKEEIDDYTSLLKIYRNLFIYYTSIKDENAALDYIEKAKDLAFENSDKTELALIDSYLGTYYWSAKKDHKRALVHLNAAEPVLNPENDYAKYANLIVEKGTIYFEIDSLKAAEGIFNTLKELSLSRSYTPDYIDALVNLTAIYLKKGEIDKAFANLEEIKLYPLDNIDFQLLTKYYTVKANYSSLVGDKRTAIEVLQPVLTQVIDRAKNNTDSQQGFWSVEDEYLDAFELLVNLYIDDDQPQNALLILDQLKTINDASLYNSPLIKAAKLSEEDLAEEKRLNEKIQSLRKRYLNAKEDERFAIKTEIDQTSALREQILSEVNLNKEKPLPPIWTIQRSIKADEMLLHFTEISTSLYVTYLTRDEVQIQVLDYSNETKERFNKIADELASGYTDLNHLFEIYNHLDLRGLSKNITQITVIPDNYLYRIPLEILPTQKPTSAHSFGSSHYLIEDFSFRYFTSLKEFENNRRSFSTSTQHDFSGFAISDFSSFQSHNLPSLPYATVENNNIITALTSFENKRLYNENEATKETFKGQVGNSRLVHLATHSEVSEQDPLFSTIYLKSSNPNDSLDSDQALYAYELFDTPLNSEFIMLNSCSSGSGSYIQGSGIMGISRALRYAGAKSLALNLWSVNDKVASEFATDFYSYLNEGATKSEAIRKAKLNQLRTANANPHFWGAYMLIGNPSPVTNNSATNRFLLFSLLAFTAFFTGYSAYYKAG